MRRTCAVEAGKYVPKHADVSSQYSVLIPGFRREVNLWPYTQGVFTGTYCGLGTPVTIPSFSFNAVSTHDFSSNAESAFEYWVSA